MGNPDGNASGGVWNPDALRWDGPEEGERDAAQSAPQVLTPPGAPADLPPIPASPVHPPGPSHDVAPPAWPSQSWPPGSWPQGSWPQGSWPQESWPQESWPPAPSPAVSSQRVSSQRVAFLVGAVVLGLLIAAGVTVGVLRSGIVDTGTTAAGPAGTVPAAPVVTSTAPVPEPDSAATLQPQPATAESEALARLDMLRRHDLQTLQFTGQWVAQLASKSVGIVDPLQTASNGSNTFYAQDILAEHLALRQEDNLGAPVVLMLTTDYGERRTYQGEALWATFALGSFTSAADVRAWCAQRFPELSGDALTNSCAPRRLEPPR